MNTIGALAGVVIKELYRRKDFYVLFVLTALINNPDLLILDEPTSGLDPLGRMKVRDRKSTRLTPVT